MARKATLADTRNAAHIGDGAYVRIDQYGDVWIFTTDGLQVDNEIYIESFDELVKTVKRLTDIFTDSKSGD